MSLFDELLGGMQDAIRILPDKPEETPERTLRALWFAAAGLPRSVEGAAAGALPDLDTGQQGALRELIGQRLGGTPVAYLTGRQRFMDLDLYVAPGALIPRKETEILGRAALSLVHEAVSRSGSAIAVDTCTGSGNLALAYAAHEPRASVLAADVSDAAIAIAVENARMLGLSGRVDFRVGDLLAPFGDELNGRVDVVSCNPPYISTAKVGAMPAEISQHEPSLAFDGGMFGVRILTRVVSDARRLLRPGGWLCIEVGLGQGEAMARRASESGAYGEIRPFTDARGAVRAIAAQALSR